MERASLKRRGDASRRVHVTTCVTLQPEGLAERGSPGPNKALSLSRACLLLGWISVNSTRIDVYVIGRREKVAYSSSRPCGVVMSPTTTAGASLLFSRLVAVSQLILLLAVPQLLWRPRWGSFLAFIGGEKNANVFGNAAVSGAMLLILNAFFYALYKLELPAVEAFRISKKAWPWKEEGWSAAQRAAFRGVVLNGALLAALNLALTIPLGWASYAGAVKLGYSAKEADFPSAATMAWQLVVFVLIEDALFYWGHRTLHESAVLYKSVHKLHHAFNYSVSIAATATHPLEFILSNVVPFVAGPTLLGAHCATIYMWIIFRMGETIFHHSGYDFPFTLWSLLPFQGSVRFSLRPRSPRALAIYPLSFDSAPSTGARARSPPLEQRRQLRLDVCALGPSVRDTDHREGNLSFNV